MCITEMDMEMCQVSQSKSLGDMEEKKAYFKGIL